MAETLDLTGLNNITQVLARLPQGQQALALMQRLGLWSERLQGEPQNTTTSLSGLSTWDNATLSNRYGSMISELHRVTELLGMLEGQKQLVSLQAKGVRATTRSRLRRQHEAKMAEDKAIKALTATALADEVEADERVQDIDMLLAMLAVVMESAKAYKEACTLTSAGMSREISFRQAQMQARL